MMIFFFFQAEDGIRDRLVTGVQTCALPIFVYGNLDILNVIGADAKKGAFISPILLRADYPFESTAIHEREAFGQIGRASCRERV